MAIRIGAKSAGPKGFFRESVEELTYEALTGRKVKLDFSVFCTRWAIPTNEYLGKSFESERSIYENGV
jgi:hypothetical protein